MDDVNAESSTGECSVVEEVEETKLHTVEEAVSGYDFIKFTVLDINGVPRTKVITSMSAAECLKNGTSFYSTIVGLTLSLDLVHKNVPTDVSIISTLNDANALMRPDISTLHHVQTSPSEKYNIGEVYCEMMYFTPDGTIPQPACPRYMARRQLGRLKEMGYELISGYEAEFAILDAATLAPLSEDHIYAATDIILVQHQEMLMGIAHACMQNGVHLDAFHKEYDPAQCEFITKPLKGIKAADNVVLLKETIKQVVMKHGKLATFMTSPFVDSASGFHFSHSLRAIADGNLAFYDKSKENRLSDVCLHWIAGILKHIDALTALCCPTVNCYRRMYKSFCPVRGDWNLDDRYVTIRAKNYSPGSCLVENRLPSSACNPYVVMAATIAAGIDGIVNKLECPARKAEADFLANSLDVALDALEKDEALKEALGGEFVAWFNLLKRWEMQKLGGSDISGTICEERLEKERSLYMKLI